MLKITEVFCCPSGQQKIDLFYNHKSMQQKISSPRFKWLQDGRGFTCQHLPNDQIYIQVTYDGKLEHSEVVHISNNNVFCRRYQSFSKLYQDLTQSEDKIAVDRNGLKIGNALCIKFSKQVQLNASNQPPVSSLNSQLSTLNKNSLLSTQLHQIQAQISNKFSQLNNALEISEKVQNQFFKEEINDFKKETNIKLSQLNENILRLQDKVLQLQKSSQKQNKIIQELRQSVLKFEENQIEVANRSKVVPSEILEKASERLQQTKDSIFGHYHNNSDRKYFSLKFKHNLMEVIHSQVNGYYNFINCQRLVDGQQKYLIKLSKIQNKNLMVGIGTKSIFSDFKHDTNFPSQLSQGIFYSCGGWIHNCQQQQSVNERLDEGDELLVNINLLKNKIFFAKRERQGYKSFYSGYIPQVMATKGLYLIIRMYYHCDSVQVSSL